MDSLLTKSFVALVLAYSAAASACPEILKQLHTDYLQGTTLCELQEHYQDVQRQLEERGLKPANRIGNVMAPRFINLPDWLAKRDNTATRAWTAYEPVPVTWANWEKTARMVDGNAKQNSQLRALQPFTLTMLKRIQGIAMTTLTNDPGQFRQSDELGMCLDHHFALTPAQVKGVNEISFPSIKNPGEGLTNFQPTVCLEEQSESFKKSYGRFSMGVRPVIDINQWAPVTTFFTAEDRQSKQCGFINYAPLDEVAPQLKLWMAYLRRTTHSWSGNSPEGDPVFIASRIQRWFIAIHPYPAGNGRTSRFVMDWLFESLGLPAPILLDMNHDMYSTEQEWAQAVGEGLLRTVHEAEACLQKPESPGCAVISEKAPLVTAEGQR